MDSLARLVWGESFAKVDESLTKPNVPNLPVQLGRVREIEQNLEMLLKDRGVMITNLPLYELTVPSLVLSSGQ